MRQISLFTCVDGVFISSFLQYLSVPQPLNLQSSAVWLIAFCMHYP